ncbi:MAG: SGNH/GDSL hydrolase family protein [Clostridia bacterium]|nr:SGNH/GDSL hydrolase family protein [Clostridia bacterium]
MKLQGAVVNFLGDSITEGSGASCTEKRYTDVFAREFGAKVNNYGIGGSRIARQITPTDPRMDRDFCLRMEEMDESADAVVVFGGTNDFGHGDAPVGTPQDRDPSTFYGACHYLMRSLAERYCGKPVLILTPLHRLGEDSPEGDGSGRRPESNKAVLTDYRAILMEVAAYYALPVLDLYAVSGMQPAVPAIQERLMPDGLHPNDEGHAILARRIGGYLLTL